MSLRVTYESGLSSEFTDVSDRFREYTFDISERAEEGAVDQSTVTIDDPDGDYDITGWRRFRFYENAATGSNTHIANLWVYDRQVERGPYPTEAGRHWVVNLQDMNAVLSFRVLHEPDANRPAETDVARIQWLQTTLGTPAVPETEYVNTSGPVAMDAVDYRGQTRINIIDDCAQASGKNYFVYTKDNGPSTPLSLGLWYDFTNSTAYGSVIRLSNDWDDIDGDTFGNTFAIGEDTALTRSPDRVFSGAFIQWDGGNTYVESLAISNEFTRRDAVVPAENVKSVAKAEARAARYLSDYRTENDRIVTSYYVPAAKVNFLRPGMRFQFRATHLPGYEDFQFLRVLQRKVRFNSEDPDEASYLVSLECASEGPGASPSACAGGIYDITPTQHFDTLGPAHTADAEGLLYYASPGGIPLGTPRPGYTGGFGFPVYDGPSGPDYAGDCTGSMVYFVLVGPGHIDIETVTNAYGATHANVSWNLYHYPGGGAAATVEDSGSVVTGGTISVDVPADSSENCVHIVRVADGTGACGGGWGWAGADWTSGG